MSLAFERIPDHGRAPAGAAKTAALKDLVVSPGRRTVLKALALGAMTIGASLLDLGGGVLGAPKAWAETGAFGLQGWDQTHCKDAYPNGYNEVGDTSGLYANTYAACFGGSFRGSDYCAAGWHKYGTFTQNDIQVDNVPVSTLCGTLATKNAWRWTTPDGHVYRCSDGFSTYWGGGMNGVTFLTICRAGI
jgi:hypothetical protein